MKKILYIFIMMLFFIPLNVFASSKQINLRLFYNETCPHCEALIEWLNEEYLPKKNNVKLYKYEVSSNFSNNDYLRKAQILLNKSSEGVPYLAIGNQAIIGFEETSTPENIKTIVNYYENNPYRDLVGEMMGEVEVNDSISMEDIDVLEINYHVPVLGNIDPKTVSLPLLAIIIGLVDGFNPCAMWILIFLISMLFGMKNRKRMWLIGCTFLITSAVVYLLFMVSWLSLASFLNKVNIIKIMIGLFALIFGIVNVINYFKSLKKDTGCEVVDDQKRKSIIKQIKKVVTENSLLIALLGVIILAISVNVIELLCSLGLPVLFTQILSMNDLSTFEYGIYILIYIIFFMLDDFVIFFIAMKTMKIKAISNKYTKYSHLIGGIIMLIIGLLMIFRPEWLMFNF